MHATHDEPAPPRPLEPPPADAAAASPRRWARVRRELGYLRAEAHLRWRIADVLARLMPVRTLSTARARLYRAAGFDIAPGVSFVGAFTLVAGGRGVNARLHIDRRSTIGERVTLNLDDAITIGADVALGPGVSIYTSTHLLGPASRRMQPGVLTRPVVIEDGAWVGVGAIILPGVVVGRGSVVSAGSVVTESIPPNMLAAGNPAKVTQELPWPDR